MNAEISAYVPIREKLANELLRDAGKGNEREGIERLLEIETALTLLEPNDPGGRGE